MYKGRKEKETEKGWKKMNAQVSFLGSRYQSPNSKKGRKEKKKIGMTRMYSK